MDFGQPTTVSRFRQIEGVLRPTAHRVRRGGGESVERLLVVPEVIDDKRRLRCPTDSVLNARSLLGIGVDISDLRLEQVRNDDVMLRVYSRASCSLVKPFISNLGVEAVAKTLRTARQQELIGLRFGSMPFCVSLHGAAAACAGTRLSNWVQTVDGYVVVTALHWLSNVAPTHTESSSLVQWWFLYLQECVGWVVQHRHASTIPVVRGKREEDVVGEHAAAFARRRTLSRQNRAYLVAPRLGWCFEGHFEMVVLIFGHLSLKTLGRIDRRNE